MRIALVACIVSVALGAALGEALAGAMPQSAGAHGGSQPAPIAYTRVVSAALSTDEVALALAPGPSLIALSTFADDAAVSNVTDAARGVRGRVTANTEALLALRPGTILADPFTQLGLDRTAEALGITLVRTRYPARLDDIPENIRMVGRALGREPEAEALALGFMAKLDAIAHNEKPASPPRVLLYGRGFTSGAGTLSDDVLARAGGRNVAAEHGVTGITPVSLETVAAWDPDVLVLTDYRADGRRVEVSPLPDSADHPAWRSLRAVREGRVVRLPPRLLLSTSHHLAEGVDVLRLALLRMPSAADGGAR